MGLRVCLFGGPGVGKCFGKNTPILMYDGTAKLVQDIVVGDLVMGDDSTPRRVLNTTSGIENLYTVRPFSKRHQKARKVYFSDEYVVNESHILALKLSHRIEAGKPCMRYANLRDGDQINIGVKEYLASSKKFKHMTKGYRTAVEFPEKSVEIDPYILGLWLGDGTSAEAGFTSFDHECVEALYDEAAKRNLLVKIDREGRYRITSGIHGGRMSERNSLINALRKYNLIGNKHIPSEYKKNSTAIRLKLIAGLMDSDGSTSNKCFDFVNKNYELACDVAWVCRSVGLYATVRPCVKSCQTSATGTYYRVCISGNCNKIPTRILRKNCSKRCSKKDVLKYGIEVVPVGRGEYFGFEVDGNHLFLLNDFTVVHNSKLGLWLTCELGKAGIDTEYVDEWIKRWAYEKRKVDGWDQRHAFASQLEKEEFYLKHGVPCVITDSPLLMQIAYMKKYGFERFVPNCISDAAMFEEDYPSINIFLNRGKLPYREFGRWQTKEEAIEMDKLVKSVMETYVKDFYEFDTTEWDDILKEVFVRIKCSSCC